MNLNKSVLRSLGGSKEHIRVNLANDTGTLEAEHFNAVALLPCFLRMISDEPFVAIFLTRFTCTSQINFSYNFPNKAVQIELGCDDDFLVLTYG